MVLLPQFSMYLWKKGRLFEQLVPLRGILSVVADDPLREFSDLCSPRGAAAFVLE